MTREITSIPRFVLTGASLAAIAAIGLATSSASAAGPATLRIVSALTGYTLPLGLTEESPGIFYGVANLSSGLEAGAAFSVTSAGVTTMLTSFPNHYIIDSGMVSGPNNRLYSSVQLIDQPPTAFSVTSMPGSVKVYPGQNILPILSQSLPNGEFLGVGIALASLPWYLVSVNTDGVVTPIYQFANNSLLTNSIYATDGNYYGVAAGNSNFVYRVTPSGTLTNVYTFPSSPLPFAGGSTGAILQASDGNLYGTLPSGGVNGTGAVYKVTLAGQYTLLHSFPPGPNGGPTALIEGSDGNLYGATQGFVYGGAFGYGLLFRVTRSGQYALLYSMNNTGVTGGCLCTMFQGSDGNIYGTAVTGGPNGGGTVFALNAGLPKPKPVAHRFAPKSGPVGTKVRIWGYNLLSASVQFNSVAASTVVNSGPNYVLATVPPGATSGPITVTTPGGTSTTKASFTVQ